MKIGLGLSILSLRPAVVPGASSAIKTLDGFRLKFKLPDGTGGLLKYK
jgi:hypothetical protein